MKNKKNSRQDFSHRYQTRMIANIVYSTLLACLVEMFLVTNLTMLAGYAKKSEWDNALLGMIGESDVIIVLGYVLVGILVFSVTFLMLQDRSVRYVGKISDAMNSIAEGDLNTTVDVVGDEEFSSIEAAQMRSVESVASNWLPSTFSWASMSSSCLVVAAPSFSRFSTRRRSVCCLAICSRSDAACFPMSGRPLRTEAR